MRKIFKKNIGYGKITDEIIIELDGDECNILVSTHTKKSGSMPEGYQSASILLTPAMTRELKKFFQDEK
jgi:hypothetical protein